MSQYARDLQSLVEILIASIREANAKDALNGYFDDLAPQINALLGNVDMEPLELVNPTWKCQYSPRRKELYIQDADGVQKFTLLEEELNESIPNMNESQLRDWVYNNCSDVLSDLGLL